MIKLVTIIGARPQFIKASAISRAIRNHYAQALEEVIVHTGQHYDPNMSRVFFEEMQVPPEKYNLQIGSGSHAQQTAGMMVKIEEVVLAEKPDALLLYGDTNSTLAATLVGVKLHIPIIHVEAGLRAYRKEMPEEVNRIIADHMAALLFVPSVAGMEALAREGFPQEVPAAAERSFNRPAVYHCGDIMYDNTLYFRTLTAGKEATMAQKYGISLENMVLCTMHRPENVDDPATLEGILEAFAQVHATHGKHLVLPLHPRTAKIIDSHERLKAFRQREGLHIIPPVSFLEMVMLEKAADLVITDSGGVQKEAYFMEKPCLIMLQKTPWPELVESGNAQIVGNSPEKIKEGARHFIGQSAPLSYPRIYGNGQAAEFICQKIVETFG